MTFITEHLLEIFFGLLSAGALGLCKYFQKQLKDYKALQADQKNDALEETIEKAIDPIREEIEELRKYVLNLDEKAKDQISLIISSYRFRLIQLCKEYNKQGYMTQQQYDQLSEFWKVYHGLGGNGQAQEYYETAMNLPVHEN